ncbi:MAG: hypothetical protein ILP19_07815 [Oscillospiraceae bacterium]|nr:hypothetical protein [Oscillospiraceae bacterium]
MNDTDQRSFADEASDLMNEFGNAVTDYYSGRIGEETLMDMTTQPFWYSLRLTGRRLRKYGLTQTLRIRDKRREMQGGRSRPLMSSHGPVADPDAQRADALRRRFLGLGTELRTNSDGRDLSAVLSDAVTTERIYFRGNKKAGSLVSDDMRYISAVRSNIRSGRVCCPNCGFENEVSTFIDGCDACGSKFDVRDFETKVSGFALEGHIPAVINRTIGDSTKVYHIFFGLYFALFMGTGIICMLDPDISGSLLGGDSGRVFAAIVFLAFFVLFFGAIVINVFAIGGHFAAAALSKKYQDRITGAYIISTKIWDFSPEDFYQYLEQELRAVHLTDRGEGLLPFYKAFNELPDYSEVIDCDLSRVEFQDVKQLSDSYEIKLRAYMRLVVFHHGRIKNVYENADVTLTGRKDTVSRPLTALRLYSCKGCGSSIDIFGSETCPYCHRPVEYSDYGYTITEYSAKTVFNLSTGTCRLIFGAAAILIVGLLTAIKGFDILSALGLI